MAPCSAASSRARSASSPDPDDVVHSAFERFAALEDPGQVDNPKAFLKSTARNCVLDQRRRMKVRADHAISELNSASRINDELNRLFGVPKYSADQQ